jgi:hypothetical protein
MATMKGRGWAGGGGEDEDGSSGRLGFDERPESKGNRRRLS